MTIWKYLKDSWLILLGWLMFFLLTCLVLWLSPSTNLEWSTVGYLLLLEAALLIAFLAITYYLRKRFWRQLETQITADSLLQYVDVAVSESEHLTQNYINNLLTEHQQVMQQAIVNQQDQKDYIDSWVHEIKVPLAAVDLMVQSIEDEISEKRYDQLMLELDKIQEYVEQVLYYARLDSFSKDYLIQEYSLQSLVQEAVRNQASYFIQKNLQFAIEGADEMVLTDAKWLLFILRQLLSNAIKYTEPGGQITVQLAKDQQGIRLDLTDTGIGIPSADLRRIFDKGFTGENGRLGEQHSTGLGLYLAQQLSQKLGHELTVTSEVGKGTTIHLLFPFLSYY